MERVNSFDRYHYLAQEVHNLPLFETIPRINKLLYAATDYPLDRQVALNEIMCRYDTAMTQAISLMLSRNIEQDPTAMIANWIRFKDDICKMFETVLNMQNFTRVCDIPLNSSPMAMVGCYIPQTVRDFWGITTAVQFMLPIVAAVQKRYLEVYNSNLTFSSMLCIIDQLMQDMFPAGWEYLCNKVYKKAALLTVGCEEVLGEIILVGVAGLELDASRYLNMCDIDQISDDVINRHAAFQPSMLPPTAMY